MNTIPKFKSTEDAIDFGKCATKETKTKLIFVRSGFLQKSKDLLQRHKFDEAMVAATQAQFCREAIEEQIKAIKNLQNKEVT